MFVLVKNEFNLGLGQCVSVDVCNCINSYGASCQIFSCNGVLNNNTNVCSGNGQCLSIDNCICSAKYAGNNCQYPICFGIVSTNTSGLLNN